MAGMNPNALVEQQLMAATQIIERQLDSEIERLDTLDSEDLDAIRRDRMVQMKKRQSKKQEWIANGHGDYGELADEKDFFEATKKSENVVCHFYRDQFERCKIVDKHFKILAKDHIEAKFCKINAEKAPFLTERLKIRILPTICLVKDGKTKDFIVGFTDLGNSDEFTTEVMEWRIARADVIEFSGDLMSPPSFNARGGQNMEIARKKTIRGGRRGGDSDDSDSDY